MSDLDHTKLRGNKHMKTAVVFFVLGIFQGMIILDWYRDKQVLKLAVKRTRK